MEDNVRKNSIVVFFSLLILNLSACNNVDDTQPELEEKVDVTRSLSEDRDDKAHILKVHTDLEEEHNWFIVPKGVNTMTISAEVENVETILFWISETGTGTWAERTLIGYDIDGSDGWSITWEFGDRIFHDRISIQALGSDGVTQASESIGVHSIVETDSE
jgi:hypothetical protein